MADLADDGFGNLIYASGVARNMYLYDTWYRRDPLIESVRVYDNRTKVFTSVLKAPLHKHGIKYANP
jgi:hypothetical protein